MANDRIYLQCVQCGKLIMLYKYYPSPDSAYFPHDEETVAKFFEEHVFGPDLDGEGHEKSSYQPYLPKGEELFRIITEGDDEKDFVHGDSV